MRPSLRRPWLLLSFLVFGVLWGAWVVVLADIARDIGMSTGELGLASSVGTVGSLPAMLLAGRLVDRAGTGPVATAAALGLAAALLLTGGGARNRVALVCCLLLLFAASGAYDVAINAAAVAFEQSAGHAVMSYLHAMFSLGGILGAVGTGVLLDAGIAFRAIYLGLGLAMLALAAVLAVTGLPTASDGGPQRGAWRLLAGRPVLVLLAAVCGAVFLSEGAMENWASYYLRTSLEVPALLGASGAALFHATMFLGRVAGGGVVARIGNLACLRWAGLLTAAGIVVAMSTAAVPVVLAGFAIVGLSLSVAFPVVLSLTGGAAGGSTGAAVSTVTLVGYGGFLVGPTLIGVLAELTSLRAAFSVFVLTGAFLTVAAVVLQRRPEGPTTPAPEASAAPRAP